MNISNRIYDVVKYILVIAFPAVETAILSLGGVLNFPQADLIVKILVIVETLLAALFCVQTGTYHARLRDNGTMTTISFGQIDTASSVGEVEENE